MQDLGSISVQTYTALVRQLGEHFDQDPAGLSEQQLRSYFLHCRKERGYVPSTMRGLRAAFLHFFHGHLRIEPRWKVFSDLKIKRIETLPVVLSREEVRDLLGRIDQIRYHTALALIYATGLRVSEACRLEVTDIDAQTGRLLVRDGKGRKSRFVPLGPEMIKRLRIWWQCHRNPRFLFPAVGSSWRKAQRTTPQARFRARCAVMGKAERAMTPYGVQEAMRFAVRSSGLKKKASVHTLRHCFATHLLEDGVSIRLISAYLGHATLQTTLKYVHLTAITEETTKTAMASLFDQVIAPTTSGVTGHE